jgi:diguanylate cyclase (GGDEF)-like protein
VSDTTYSISNAAAWSAVGPPLPSRVPAAVLDRHGVVIATNGALPAGIVVGSAMTEAVAAERRRAWRAALEAAASGRATGRFVLDRRGTAVEIHPWRGGAIIYVAGDSGDAEPRVAISAAPDEPLLRSIVEALSASVVVLRPERNPAGCIVNARVLHQNAAAAVRWGALPAGALFTTDERERGLLVAVLERAWNGEPQRNAPTTVKDAQSPVHVADVEWRRVDDVVLLVGADRTTDRDRIEEIDRFRDVVAALDEAIYVYAPIFDEDGEIVDLCVLEQNPAAVAQPRSSVTHPYMLASEGFRDPELAIDAARAAWRAGRAEPYLLRIADFDGPPIYYEISTLRAGDLLVQVSANRSASYAVQEAAERYRRTLESLDQAVVVFAPIWRDGVVVDATIEYTNATALAVAPAIARWTTLSAAGPTAQSVLRVITSVAMTGVPRQVLIENPGRSRVPIIVPELLSVACSPDGDRVIAVATDRTELQRAEHERRATQALLEEGVAHLVEPFLVLQPILDDAGEIIDASLVYANSAAAKAWVHEFPIGDRLTEHWSRVGQFVVAARAAWSGQAARYRIDTFAEPLPELVPTVHDVTVVRAGDLFVLTSNDRTAELMATRELEASEARFRSTADALVQQMHVHEPVFDEHGRFYDTEIVYANPAAQEAIPRGRAHAGMRGSELFSKFNEVFDALYGESWLHPGAAASVVVDNLGGNDPAMPTTYLEVQARRIGEQIVTVAVDRTVEMRAVRALQRSQARLRDAFEEVALAEERFRTSVEAMREPLLLLDDADGARRVVYANDAAARLLRHLPADSIGLPVVDAVEDQELATILTEDSMDTVAVHLVVDGRPRTFDVSRTASGMRRIAVLRDVSTRDAEAAMLDVIATHDPHTGLPNRLLLDRHVGELLGSTPGSKPFTVVVLEIDQLETIQRSLGFRVADRIVIESVQRLIASVPNDSFVAGLSTTSFAVVLDDPVEQADVLELATDLVKILARPIDVDGTLLHVGATAGISYAPLHGGDAEELVMRAKSAAWMAGRQQRPAQVWRPEADTESTRRVEQLGEIDRALSSGEMFLEYQPRIELVTRRFVGAEALVRWRHPQRGLISPSEFVADVEQSAFAIPFTAWTLRSALSTWLANAGQLPAGARVAVNLPARLVANPGLVALVSEALAGARASAEVLELEITERGLVGAEDIVVENLEALRSLGVKVLIDDFGTGHASLGYLRRLPLAGVKIDQMFITGLEHDRVNQAVVTACLGVAAAVGIEAIAEGVETEQELAAAIALGCEQGQGYLIAPPGSMAALLEHLDGDRFDTRHAHH